MSAVGRIGDRIEKTPGYIWKKAPQVAAATAISGMVAVGVNLGVDKWIDNKTVKVGDPWNPAEVIKEGMGEGEMKGATSNYWKAQGINVAKAVLVTGTFLSILSNKGD